MPAHKGAHTELLFDFIHAAQHGPTVPCARARRCALKAALHTKPMGTSMSSRSSPLMGTATPFALCSSCDTTDILARGGQPTATAKIGLVASTQSQRADPASVRVKWFIRPDARSCPFPGLWRQRGCLCSLSSRRHLQQHTAGSVGEDLNAESTIGSLCAHQPHR